MRNSTVRPQDLAKREEAFRVYRDMGVSRSYKRLQRAMKPKFGEVSLMTFSNWAKAHSWKERLVEHDETARAAALIPVDQVAADFDERGALLQAARLALTRALQSVPTVQRPQDFKALVDAAQNALLLLQKLDRDKPQQEEAASRKRMFDALARIEDRIRSAGRSAKLIEGEVIAHGDASPHEVVMVEESVERVVPGILHGGTTAERLRRRRQQTGHGR